MRDTATIPAGVPNEWVQHVYPTNDWREHDTANRGECWCRPRIDAVGMGYVVMHKAARDGDCQCSTH